MLAGGRLSDGPVLDYGVGWGRLSRLLLKYVPIDALHGADAWERSLEQARSCGLRHPLRRVSSRLEEGELSGYSLIYAFSVFTHLPPDSFTHNIARLSDGLVRGGRLIVTVRPPEYWAMSSLPSPDPEKVAATYEAGIIHSSTKPDYGDTAVAPGRMKDTLLESGLTDIQSDWFYGEPYHVFWSARRA